MTTIRKVILLILCLSLCGTVSMADSFDLIKKNMSEADCVALDFLSVISSDLFDSVDTTRGSAIIAKSGKYDIKLGLDRYSFDSLFSYSYSVENNQVIIESAGLEENQVSFITRLDEFYKTAIIVPDSAYFLTRFGETNQDIPDSMIVFIDPVVQKIELIEYFDVNDDLNQIIIIFQDTEADCPSGSFTPVYPDSVERVRL